MTDWKQILDVRNQTRVIDITDPGKDLDDEQKFLLEAGLIQAGILDLLAVVANLDPPLARAKLAKGTFNCLGMPQISVGIGTDCFKGGLNLKHETDVAYATNVVEKVLWNGLDLLRTKLEMADDKSVTLSLNSGLTDAAQLCTLRPDLVRAKVKEVVIMGGVKSIVGDSDKYVPLSYKGPDGVNYMLPDDAANNSFDWPSAMYLYQWLQENKVPMVVFMRWAPYACQFPFSTYDLFAATGNPVGVNLLARQKPSINQLWAAALAPAGSEIRGKLPMSRDRKWFVNVFCKGKDPGIGENDEVWPYVGDYNQYDAMSLAVCVPEIRAAYFDPVVVEVKGVQHQIIGISEKQTGIKDGDGLRQLITDLEVNALKASVA